MPWHLSKSDPRKVYDERHQTVGVMQTPEQAALIVDAVNAWRVGYPETIRLREPLARAGATVGQTPRPLNSYDPDPCCGASLSKAISLNPGIESWECPKCGSVWLPAMVGAVRHWSPVVAMEVFRI